MNEKELVAYTAILASSEGLHRPMTLAEDLVDEKHFKTVAEARAFVEKWMPVLVQLENWLDMAKALSFAIPDDPGEQVVLDHYAYWERYSGEVEGS